jgi:hypothetical protein
MQSIHSADAVTIVGAGTVVSPALLASGRQMTTAPGETLDVAAGSDWPESGVFRMIANDARDRKQVAAALAARCQRALPMPSGLDVANGRAMLAIRITEPSQLAASEATIRRATYKDIDAKVARFNRRTSLPISVALIRTPLTANQLSIILVAIGFYSAWLFSLGHYWTGVLAAFLSLAASVLDGCDGEIARLKYQESALGCWIETFGDYSYYIAIFAGLTVGAVRQTHWDGFYWLGAGRTLGHAAVVLDSDLPPRTDHRRPSGEAPRGRACALQVCADVSFSHDLADVVRRDARRHALRHHGLRCRVCAARNRRARSNRCQRLLDQPRAEDAAPARDVRGDRDCIDRRPAIVRQKP